MLTILTLNKTLWENLYNSSKFRISSPSFTKRHRISTIAY